MVNFCWVFPFFHTTAAFYHLQAGHTGCLCSAWWLIINKYDNVIFQYPHWGEREGGGRERKECWKSSGFWDTLQIQTLKLQWNAGVMSIWWSTGRFQVCFCQEPRACYGRNRRDSGCRGEATPQPRLASASASGVVCAICYFRRWNEKLEVAGSRIHIQSCLPVSCHVYQQFAIPVKSALCMHFTFSAWYPCENNNRTNGRLLIFDCASESTEFINAPTAKCTFATPSLGFDDSPLCRIKCTRCYSVVFNCTSTEEEWKPTFHRSQSNNLINPEANDNPHWPIWGISYYFFTIK